MGFFLYCEPQNKEKLGIMYKIVEKEILAPKIGKFVIEAPEIAKSRKPGNFIILRVDAKGERIPLTIVDSDVSKGTITLIVQEIGVTTGKLMDKEPGDYLLDVVGPLGKPTEIHKVGTVLAVGGGVGVAPLYPIAKGFKEAGNKVVSVIAAKTKELLILEDDMRQVSDEVIVYTDDGSYGKKGLITVGMEEVLERENVDESIIIGPAIMMKFAALLTKKYNVKTMASLNSLMVDGTGMCGACRVTVGGRTVFTCVDGPEFDAHQVDFDELLTRLTHYKDQEVKAYEEFMRTRKSHAVS